MGAELQKSYEIEKQYYEVKKDYFYERTEFGDLNLENLLEVDKELRNISDKILANSVKQIERLNFLNISEDLIPIKHNISDTDVGVLNSRCDFKPILGSEYKKGLVNHKYVRSIRLMTFEAKHSWMNFHKMSIKVVLALP